MSEAVASSLPAYSRYSAGVGSLPRMAETAASSADARYTFAPLPSLLGKFLVDVETTVDFSATLAWLPMQREQPGISVLAPTVPYME